MKDVAKNFSQQEENRRRRLLSNWTLVLNTAIDNLHKSLWFGIKEDIKKGMEMFRYQSGLDMQPMKRNMNKGYPKPTEEQIEKLKKLMPMDMYLYEYAKQLHEYRYERYKQQQQQQQGNAESIRRDDSADFRISLKLPAVLDGCQNDGRILKCNQNDPYYKKLERQYAITHSSGKKKEKYSSYSGN